MQQHSSRFISFSLHLVLVLISTTAVLSAYAKQGGSTSTEERNALLNQEALVVLPAAPDKDNKLGGRKMLVTSNLMRPEKEIGEWSKVIIEKQKNKKMATCLEGDEEGQGRNLLSHDVEEQEMNSNTNYSNAGDGSVAFNEDYHSARHHPPKNN